MSNTTQDVLEHQAELDSISEALYEASVARLMHWASQNPGLVPARALLGEIL